MRGLSALQLEHYYKMAQEVVFANHEEDGGGGVQLTRGLTLGCELSCITVQGDTFRGNLVAHDEEAMLIVIKSSSSEPPPPTAGSDSNRNVHIINLRHAAKLEVTFAPLTPPTSYTKLPQLDTERIRRRLQTNTEAKWREIRSRGVDVTNRAQQLYNYISKMYNDIDWDKDVIVVLKDVRISPPYGPENCEGSLSACNRIKKQVAKFHNMELSSN